jgi:hypothetical protein
VLSHIGCCASLPLTSPTKRCAQQIFRDDCCYTLRTIETTFQYQLSRRNHLSSLAGAGVSEHLARHHCQAERVIEFAICEQSASEVTTDPRNWSVNLRSKSSLRTPSVDSPVGFSMTVSHRLFIFVPGEMLSKF